MPTVATAVQIAATLGTLVTTSERTLGRGGNRRAAMVTTELGGHASLYHTRVALCRGAPSKVGKHVSEAFHGGGRIEGLELRCT